MYCLSTPFREGRRHQDTNEEIISDMHHSDGSDRSHKISNKDVEDDEALRPAKWKKLRSALAQEGPPPQPRSLTPPSATQLEDTSRYKNQPESRKGSSPSPTVMMNQLLMMARRIRNGLRADSLNS